MAKDDAGDNSVCGQNGIRYDWVMGFVVAASARRKSRSHRRMHRAEGNLQPRSAAKLRERGREFDLTTAHAGEQSKIKKVFEYAHVSPVCVTFCFLAADEVREAEECDLRLPYRPRSARPRVPRATREDGSRAGELSHSSFPSGSDPMRNRRNAWARQDGPSTAGRQPKSPVELNRLARSSHWSGETFRSKSFVLRASP